MGMANPADGREAGWTNVPEGQTAFEFLGRSDQAGPQVTHYGYLTHVFGLSDDQLFAAADPHNEATARLTFSAVTTIDGRYQHANIITTSAPGEMTLYLNDNPQGDFANPASFSQGTPIATYSTRYHNVLNVQAPNQGATAASVELTQLSSAPFVLAGRRVRFGQPGLRARLTAHGSGTRTQPDPVSAFFLVGGHVVVIDS